MTQEEKSLLLQDLCCRLPCGVKVQPSGSATPHKFVGYDKSLARIDTDQKFELENIKPCLRPMSSMTEEERTEYFLLKHRDNDRDDNIILLDEASTLIDWLNAHHFDYRGLIKEGLALEAPEGMYNKEK